jgi:hypothetical protein
MLCVCAYAAHIANRNQVNSRCLYASGTQFATGTMHTHPPSKPQEPICRWNQPTKSLRDNPQLNSTWWPARLNLAVFAYCSAPRHLIHIIFSTGTFPRTPSICHRTKVFLFSRSFPLLRTLAQFSSSVAHVPPSIGYNTISAPFDYTISTPFTCWYQFPFQGNYAIRIRKQAK